jgi:hypothetical protein
MLTSQISLKKTDFIQNNNVLYFDNKELKEWFNKNFNIEIYNDLNHAFILEFNGKYHLKIIKYIDYDKKEGDNFDYKLKTGEFIKREYELMLKDKFTDFIISISFIISKNMQKKLEKNEDRYKICKQIQSESNINIFYETSNKLYKELSDWVNKF